MPASQDYRDGAAYGALELVNRIFQMQRFGLVPTQPQLRSMADEIAFSEMGGRPDICGPCGWLNGRHSDTCPTIAVEQAPHNSVPTEDR